LFYLLDCCVEGKYNVDRYRPNITKGKNYIDIAILDKAMPGTENTRGLNLAAVRRTTVPVTLLPL
jgi:hypothetical protein